MVDVKIDPLWKNLLEAEFQKDYFLSLVNFVKLAYRSHIIYPKAKEIFNAFSLCNYEMIKVVILGQDPYHGPNQAHGLCFSVNEAVPMPPSLVNIFKEIRDDIGKPIPNNGNLTRWSEQGILLLNATLTVQAGLPGSHQNKGWEKFTDAVIQKLSLTKENLVFLLWGSYAQKKEQFIDSQKHLILKSAHPSPLSATRGFFGNRHFSKTNTYLSQHNLPVIDW